jgi:2-polyprenyl-3-methyl-5-hydroxy-6-metoxy-1,4-benzoquinol methylase
MVKRFLFLEETIRSQAPKEVLDIGCGNGHYLTIPLACSFPGVRFFGIDTDGKSIEQARNVNSLANLEFSLPGEIREGGKYDFIIASEIIEHVEDPEGFLLSLKERLNPGKIFLSMPNGYGRLNYPVSSRRSFICFFATPDSRNKPSFPSVERNKGTRISDNGMENTLPKAHNFFP